MSVKLLTGLPKADRNGFAGQEERIEDLEGKLVPIVILAEVREVGRVVSTDEPKVILGIGELEIVDEEAALKLIREGRKNRTGAEELDIEGIEVGADE